VFKLLIAPISWCTKKQPVESLSTCEYEYIAGCLATCQAVWLDFVLKELNIKVCKPIVLFIGNKSTINLANNHVLHGRSKNIEAKFHFLIERVNKKALKVIHCSTEL